MQSHSKLLFYICIACCLSLRLAAAYPDYQAHGGQLRQGPSDPISGTLSLAYSTQQLAHKLLIRLSPEDQPIRVEAVSPSQSLCFSSWAEQAQGRWQISFFNANAEARSATVEIEIKGQGWLEVSIALPPALRSFEGIILQPLSLEAGRAQIHFAGLRFDPAAYALNALQAAQAMGVSIEVAREILSFNLDELLAWNLMRIAARGMTPQEILRQRATKSWGEIAQAAGTSWGQIVDEVEARTQAGGIQAQPANPAQAWRSMSNAIGKEARP